MAAYCKQPQDMLDIAQCDQTESPKNWGGDEGSGVGAGIWKF